MSTEISSKMFDALDETANNEFKSLQFQGVTVSVCRSWIDGKLIVLVDSEGLEEPEGEPDMRIYLNDDKVFGKHG